MQTVAWVKGEDIRAVRGDDGVERLYVYGEVVNLPDDAAGAVQQVINYGMAGKRGKLNMRRFWYKCV